MDALALAATRVWLSDSTAPDKARRYARRVAVGAILASLLGNAMYHALAAGLVQTSWTVVVVVGGVPPITLGVVTHLAALRKQVDAAVPQSVPGTTVVPGAGTPYATENELLSAARAADAGYRAAHGRPITRDALRKELRISAARATAVVRQVRAESQPVPRKTR